MPTNRGTGYAETEALLAAIADDEEGVEQWLRELLPGERATLDSAIHRMSATLMHLRHGSPDQDQQDGSTK